MKPFAIAAALMLLLGTAISAHHSLAAAYRLDEMESVSGRIVQTSWREPHSFLHVEAMDRHGVTRRWSTEWDGVGNPSSADRALRALRVGDQVLLAGHPGRNPSDYRLLIVEASRPVDGWSWSSYNPH